MGSRLVEFGWVAFPVAWFNREGIGLLLALAIGLGAVTGFLLVTWCLAVLLLRLDPTQSKYITRLLLKRW